MKYDSLQIGSFTFDWGSRTYMMGILNVTPDSFSGDGIIAKGDAVEFAMKQAQDFLSNGADILDVGGESTRPGSEPVNAEEEMKRVIPVVSELRKNFPAAIISIDTYKAGVAEEAIRAGANIVNDVWAFRADPQIASVAAKYKTPVILMHNRSNPASVEVRERLGGSYIGAEYDNLIEDVKRELLASVEIAVKAGVEEKLILLDPGIGFGKKREHNLELINRLDEIRSLGYPILLGTSRKSFIGFTLDLPADQRVEGTAATVAVGITRGADIIRAHDVKEMARVAKMTDAIVRTPESPGTSYQSPTS
ncbi:MAG: dihydropteroate synthase [Chloroflexi bacterium CFX1]|nr:dihydropteroate synthase [Chloroflexi bacterium CFX1]MCK6566585.1 dihydropteroate synthase [Anaerolineales bacterium]MDL1919578.1 dihydropteroate synthase [Chloroflexi bacterium CFX5]NUQ59482.1 dihydropteroate synthase [Anaerolineales bacterium]